MITGRLQKWKRELLSALSFILIEVNAEREERHLEEELMMLKGRKSNRPDERPYMMVLATSKGTGK